MDILNYNLLGESRFDPSPLNLTSLTWSKLPHPLQYLLCGPLKVLEWPYPPPINPYAGERKGKNMN